MASPARQRLDSPQALADLGLMTAERARELAPVAARYATALSPALLKLIDRADAGDPIARQFVPDPRELVIDAAETADPIGDDLRSPVKGLVHRYPDRVLIKLVSVCAVYCRFCFRRERVGPGGEALGAGEFAAALDYIRARPAIWEAVLTGGDPLMLSARRLADTTAALAAIDHLKVLRWHTRLPVAAPERVTRRDGAGARRQRQDGCRRASRQPSARTDPASARRARPPRRARPHACQPERAAHAGVNDDVATLEALMRAFVEAGVKPYYLHHGDLAPGTAPLAHLDRRGRGADARVAQGAFPASPCRPTSSTVPAPTARSRSRLRRCVKPRPDAMS